MTRNDLILNAHHALGGNMTNDDKAILIQLMYEKIEAAYQVLFGLENFVRQNTKDSYLKESAGLIGKELRTALEK